MIELSITLTARLHSREDYFSNSEVGAWANPTVNLLPPIAGTIKGPSCPYNTAPNYFAQLNLNMNICLLFHSRVFIRVIR